MSHEDEERKRTQPGDETAEPVARAAAPRPFASEPSPRYEMLGEHGRGGLGRVSRARDRELGRDVAIKELIARGEVSEARFRREALITARLEHPGIVPLYEAGQWADGTPYYAMKLVAGRPLRTLIAERATVAARQELLHHVIAVADALAYAHGQKIIHRDLKPANVIVGEFGETVVIDWGLAKDLGDEAAEAEPQQENVSPGDASDDLTRTGMVLGTPAYMPPEQERGEAVDYRADVFAIGAMLWELCSLTKVPPSERGLRHRLLRQNGVDPDLVIILDKCLAPDRAQRYADAAALAADLRAFKAGARISARSYSLPAMLGHWARRNRRIAIAVAIVVCASIAGVVLYARNLAAERSRVEALNQRLILEDARAMMLRDPTGAYDLLQTYRGDQPIMRALLEAEAVGRGVAILRLEPRGLPSLYVFPIPGAFITVSSSSVFAKVFVNGAIRHLNSKPGARYNVYYSYLHHWLIYICVNGDLCVYDADREQQIEPPDDPALHDLLDVSLSPDGESFSAVTRGGVVSVRRLSHLARPAHWQATPVGAKYSYFVGRDTLLVSGDKRLDIVSSLAGPNPRVVSLAMAPVWSAAQSERGHLVVGTSEGELVVVEPRGPVVAHRMKACERSNVGKVAFLNDDAMIAYRCGLGQAAGLWRYATGERDELMSGASALVISQDRRYLCIGSFRGEIIVYDTQAHAIAARFTTRAATYVLAPPTSLYPYLVSRDLDGALRAWRMPESPIIDRMASTAANSTLVPLVDGSTMVFENGHLRRYARDGHISEMPQSSDRSLVRVYYAKSPTAPRIVAYGDEQIDMWSFAQAAVHYQPLNVLHRELSSVVFTRDGASLMVVRNDAVIERWPIDGTAHVEVQRVPWPLQSATACPGTGMILLRTKPGFLWLLADNELRFAGISFADLMLVRCSPDGARYAIADVAGRVDVLDTPTMRWSHIADLENRIAWLALSPNARELAVVTPDAVEMYRLDGRSDGRASAPPLAIVRPQSVAYSPDNRWLAIMADHGALSLYRRADAHWVVVPLGDMPITSGVFSDDSTRFFAKDASGMVYVIDMTVPMFRASS